MGLINNNSPSKGFLSSIFSSKAAETAKTTQEKIKNLSPLREFLKSSDSPRFNLFGKAKEISPNQAPVRQEINKSGIEKQAEHINAVRQGKIWAENNPSKPLGTSANEVHALKSPGQEKPSAFFKVGSHNESASGTMEAFMWKIANILGDAKQFAATSQTSVSMKQNESGANETRKGGIQTAQNAITLGKYIDNPPGWNLSKTSLLTASLASMVYGMGDAHADNILIDKTSHEIVFFDNTRSLPSTNGYLDRGFGLVSSFRSGLMELDESHTPLEKTDIDLLKAKLGEYKAKVSALKSFMNSPQTIQSLSSLPPGWINREKAISAMEERIDRLQKALESSDSISLRDLAMAMSPQYKIASAFEIAHKMIESKNIVLAEKDIKAAFQNGEKEIKGSKLIELLEKNEVKKELYQDLSLDPEKSFDKDRALNLIKTIKQREPPPNYGQINFLTAQSIQKATLGSVGYRTMNQLFDTCSKAGVDPSKIKELCDDPLKSFDEIVMDIGLLMETDLAEKEEIPVPMGLLRELYSESDLDLKDVERNRAIQDTLDFITEKIELENIFDQCEIVNDTPPKMYLRYTFNNKEQVHALDYLTVPGKVIVQFSGKELPPMTPSELKSWMANRSLPKGSEGFMQLIAKLTELQIPLKALNPIDAIREARNLGPGEFFIAEERARSTPKLTVYLKNNQGQIESYDLKFNSKLDITLKLGTLEKNLSLEKLKELLTSK
ncbi:MAG: hypothetical protein ACK4HV_02115 [Parachlamydiaceae bacterium]